MLDKKLLSIIIPAYNEEDRLSGTLLTTTRYLESNQINFEIIVVSDGSQDRTQERVRALSDSSRIRLISNLNNRGKGYSVRRGMLSAKGDYILYMDADNSTSIAELTKFLPYLEQFDLVIGSRALPDSMIFERQSWIRETAGKIFNKIVQFLFISGIRDSQCGFKMFRRAAALDILKRAKIDRFIFDVEILYIARLLNYKILELPVNWSDSKPSRVSFLKDSFNIVFDLIRIYSLKLARGVSLSPF